MKKLRSLIIPAMILLLAGCGGSTTSGTSGGSSPTIANGLNLPAGANALLSVRVTSGGSQAALALGGVELETFLLCLEEIDLETEETAEDGDTEIDLEGPFVLNLIDGTVENLGSSNIDDDADDDGEEDSEDTDDDNDGTPDSEDADDDDDGVADADDSVPDEIEIFDALSLPAGTYHEIEAELDECDADEGINPESPLADNSLVVTGTADGVPFNVQCDFDEEFEKEDPAGIVVDDTSIASFVLSFNLDGLFAGVDFSASNDEICDQLKANLHDISEIDNDEDGDGEPDSDDDENKDEEDEEDDDDEGEEEDDED